jgi:hypothetical protein
MKNELITENVWQFITEKAKATKTKSYVAVAYFGQGASSMLPLNKGSKLLVDASESNVKAMQTCPAELLKLYKKGVQIYSLPSLHAKMYVLGKNLIIGSANVSSNSSSVLTESVFSTTDPNAVKDAKEFIMSNCGTELSEDKLKELNKIYIEAKQNSNKRFGAKIKVKKNEDQKIYVCKLRACEYTEEEENDSKIGLNLYAKNNKVPDRHSIDSFIWDGKLSFKVGDSIMQIIKDGDMIKIYPLSRLVYIMKAKSKGKTIYHCFVELPSRRAVKLERFQLKFNTWEFIKINTSVYKNTELTKLINKYWQK